MNIILIPAIAVVVAIVGGRIITKIKEGREKDKKADAVDNTTDAEA